jgi:hypothetical protein
MPEPELPSPIDFGLSVGVQGKTTQKQEGQAEQYCTLLVTVRAIVGVILPIPVCVAALVASARAVTSEKVKRGTVKILLRKVIAPMLTRRLALSLPLFFHVAKPCRDWEAKFLDCRRHLPTSDFKIDTFDRCFLQGPRRH